MHEEMKQDIHKLVQETHNLPEIFHAIWNERTIFADDEEIIDSVFIQRDGFEFHNGAIKKGKNWTPATLLIATNYGITILTEGGELLKDSMYGYRIKHILYEKINSIELNICLLSGKLLISTMSNSDSDQVIDFNSFTYYKIFERLVQNIRKKIFKKQQK